jgi:glycosyltransferase involved in cell wall biosynthesis
LTLTLVGGGTERQRLEEQANILGVGSSVRFPGWVEFQKIWGYIDSSTVCLIPHVRTEHTDTTLPNKLFDYMAKGKPVVASDCAPIERVIRETNCGLTFRSGDVEDLQTALRTMLADDEVRRTRGQNGQKAVLEKYNWEVDEKSLLQAIQIASFDKKDALLMPEQG